MLIVVYVASQLGSTLLMPTGVDPQQQMMRCLFMAMPFIFVFFVIRFPVGLMLYWITTNLWTVGQQAMLRKVMGPPPNQPPPKAKEPRSARSPKPTRRQGAAGRRRSRRKLMGGELRSFEAEGAGETWPRRGRRRCGRCASCRRRSPRTRRVRQVSEGERGLMGVGREPARVMARAQVAAVALGPRRRARARRRRAHRRGDRPGLPVTVAEHGTRVIAARSGGDTARLIGHHGHTIDAMQHLARPRRCPGSDGEWEIVVDTAGLPRAPRAALRALALKAAERRRARGRAQALEPMSSAERASCTSCWPTTRRRDGERGPRAGALRRRPPARLSRVADCFT